MKKAKQKETKKYRPRIIGICADAEQLGYSYRHLAKVIRGERHSPRAMYAYRALKQAQNRETNG